MPNMIYKPVYCLEKFENGAWKLIFNDCDNKKLIDLWVKEHPVRYRLFEKSCKKIMEW